MKFVVSKGLESQLTVLFCVNMKINWSNVIKVVKFLGTVLTAIAGTLAVQSCSF